MRYFVNTRSRSVINRLVNPLQTRYNGRSMDIRAQLLQAVASSALSERRISVIATGSPDTLRSIRNGAVPRADTLERLADVLGLRLHLTPGLSHPEDPKATGRQPRTRFAKNRQLPVYEWTDPSEKGYLRQDTQQLAPAPENLDDKQAFYVRMPDNSMLSAKIWKNDYCLVSPCAPLRVDQRAWLREPTGRETIKWVMRLSADGYDLGAWNTEPGGEQQPVAEHRTREDVVDRGVVIAAYRTEPSVTKPPPPPVEWRPDALAELWRSGLFRDAPREAAAKLNTVITALNNLEAKVKQMLGSGELSDADVKQFVRVLEFRVHDALRNIRFLLPGASSDAS